MLDAHCHLDRYPEPQRVASQAQRRGVFVIAVTQLPSHFRSGLPHSRRFERVRLALGLHPLAADAHPGERTLFSALIGQTSYVGEVGLDFSPEGKRTREVQVASLRFVASEVARAGVTARRRAS